MRRSVHPLAHVAQGTQAVDYKRNTNQHDALRGVARAATNARPSGNCVIPAPAKLAASQESFMRTVSRFPIASGPAPTIAIHCSASSPRQWEGYRALLDPAMPLQTPTLLGYDSGAEWVRGLPVTLEAEAHHLLEVILAAGQPVHLLAHSYGGAVAMQMALLWPQRVRSLTLYEPSAFHLLRRDSASAVHAEEISAVARRVELLSISGRKAEAAALFIDYWATPGAWQRMSPARQADVALRMSKVRAEFGAIFHAGLDARGLQLAHFPMRIVVGDHSPAPARRVSELLRLQVPKAEMIRMPGLDHMAPLTQREALAPVLFPHALRRTLPLAA
jgi:pimeloyl-ACP methyl ester carboxylesterase